MWTLYQKVIYKKKYNKYKYTNMQKYKSTKVQMYKNTKIQKHKLCVYMACSKLLIA